MVQWRPAFAPILNVEFLDHQAIRDEMWRYARISDNHAALVYVPAGIPMLVVWWTFQFLFDEGIAGSSHEASAAEGLAVRMW